MLIKQCRQYTIVARNKSLQVARRMIEYNAEARTSSEKTIEINGAQFSVLDRFLSINRFL